MRGARRPKFKFSEKAIVFVIDAIVEAGIESGRVTSSYEVIDPKDVVFYEVAMSKDDSYLVTGNTKQFPAESSYPKRDVGDSQLA